MRGHRGEDLPWRNSTVDGLTGLLPGLPSFLCEFLAPRARLGRDSGRGRAQAQDDAAAVARS
ncbi:MAG: hypothetical protein M3O34_02585 [Chloroflexota bacterium]|nr:hypothetical protein [Chloroflexota bacterium]